MQHASSSNKQYIGFDITKFFAAICVIAIHTNPIAGGTKFYYLYDLVVRSAVPYFFITSSFLLFRKYESTWNTVQNQKILWAYLLRIVKQYVLWSVIYIPISIYGEIKIYHASITEMIYHAVRGYLLIGQQWYSWPLWYLLSTVYAALLIWILQKKLPERFIISIGMIVYLCSYVITWLSFFDSNIKVLIFLRKVINVSFGDGRIFSGIGYFVVGMFFARYRIRPSKRLCVGTLIIFSVMSLLTQYTKIEIPYTPLLIIVAIAIFVLTESWSRESRSCLLLRNMSSVIYYTHMIWYFLGGVCLFGISDARGIFPFVWTCCCSSIMAVVIVKIGWNTKMIRTLFR